MNKDYFLNNELKDDDPLLHFAFHGIKNNKKINYDTIIDKNNNETMKIIFKKLNCN